MVVKGGIMDAKEYWNNIDPKKNKNVGSTRADLPKIHSPSVMPVQVLFTITDPVIIKDIDDHDLWVKDPRFINVIAADIYKHVQLSLKYKNDGINTGYRDYRMFPYELRSYGQGDCDDHAVNIISYLVAASVPEWRVRVVEGTTRQGHHATVYVLKDNLKDWAHLNSTGKGTTIHSLDDASIFGKGKICTNGTWSGPVGLDIVEPTCSYNNINAWSGFTGQTNEELYIMKTYKIPYIVGNHPTSGWKGAISINNHSSAASVIEVTLFDYSSGDLISSTEYDLTPWGSILLGPNDLHTGRQQIEITGVGDFLITALQFGESGITELKTHEVLSKKS